MKKFFVVSIVIFTYCSVSGQWVKTSYPYWCDGLAKTFQYKNFQYVVSYYVHRTSDKGATWEDLSDHFPTNRRVQDVAIINDYMVVAGFTAFVDSVDGMFGSADSGFTWQWVNKNSVHTLRSFYGSLFTIDYVTNSGSAYQSLDSGRTWKKLGDGLPGEYSTDMILSHDEKYLYASFESGIYRSSDSGITWNKLNVLTFLCYGLFFHDSILYAGNVTGIYRSSDYGDTWKYLSWSTHLNNAAHFVSYGNYLFASSWRTVGDDGAIYYTSDQGETWYNFSGNIGSQRTYFLFVQGDYIFVAVDDGIFRRPLSDLLNVEQKHLKNSTIYPNPTTGMFSINTVENIQSVTVTNILGEVVYSSKGRDLIENEIDLSSYPSGMYNCFIQTAATSLHRPIILQR